jgi:serine/threonine protein kinase
MNEQLSRIASALENRFRIEREIGSGGMATVYLARDLKHDRDVALKILRPELAAILGAERFLNEIRITARLDHPHILTLIDSGEADGLLYYVLPLVRGESLRERLRRERHLGVDAAIDITRQIGSALQYAHGQGVIHRDVKPENILLHQGEAVLADFGIALAVQQAAGDRLTASGLSLGTPQYMSPEQATGDKTLDARADEYSLAAVLYEMLVGEAPHSGPNVQAIIAKLLTQRPVRVRTIRETIPDSLDAAVDKGLARLPADRFPTVADFVNAVAAQKSTPLTTSPRPGWHWIVGVTVLAAAVATVVTLTSLLLRGNGAVEKSTAASPPEPAFPVAQVEQQLLDANVPLSEGLEPAVRGWLRDDRAYQVLSRTTIDVMKGKRLIAAVPLDLISSEYKAQFGYGRGQYLPAEKWNDAATLKMAIVRAWNITYPEKTKSAFDSVIVIRP